MTTKGKIVLTILILGVVGFGVYRWWDKIAPQSRPQNQSLDVARVKADLEKQKTAAADIPLLAGTNVAALVERSGIPAVTGVSDYTKSTKDKSFVVQFPINVWPGWAPIIVANAGLEPNDQSVFFKKHGFYVRLSIVDDPVKARDLFASGQSHILRSEEHTSELQSHLNLICRLLLEKKKKTTYLSLLYHKKKTTRGTFAT